jgi:hypothetical protein
MVIRKDVDRMLSSYVAVRDGRGEGAIAFFLTYNRIEMLAGYLNIFMNTKLVNLTYEIELQTGEKLVLPDSIARAVGAGRWLITISPSTEAKELLVRSHDAFLNGYVPEDEGLYDDYPTG